ncbi:MAG TPA: hypothetical protein PLQ88_33270, partial [Blastocatellia bacterium]|nr:hypothetical protein [Blastocatellia bacterium]
MNCRQFETIVTDLARNKPMEAGLREGGLSHAAACERCGARLSDERTLTAGLKACAADLNQTAAPQHIETALLAAFRRQAEISKQAAASNNVVALPVRNRRPQIWVFAAAAAILIAALTFAASRLIEKPSAIEPAITYSLSPQAPPVEKAEKKDDDVALEIADPDKKPPVKSRKKRLPRQPHDRSQVVASIGEFTPVFGDENGQEVATDFFPLVYEQVSQPLESG